MGCTVLQAAVSSAAASSTSFCLVPPIALCLLLCLILLFLYSRELSCSTYLVDFLTTHLVKLWFHLLPPSPDIYRHTL